jgi:negative regulator of genetic competence, sporulation and motility
MELIVISDTKLKVMLTPTDMQTYGLDFSGDEYDNAKTRRAIWHLFDEVKRRCGFDVAGDRVMVQLWPAGDGGCEIYVNKLGTPPPRRERPNAPPRFAKRLYTFEALRELLAVCRALEHSRYARMSEVWLSDDGAWYLVLEASEGGESVDELSFIEEYGLRLRSAGAMQLLTEHGSPIALGNAVERMASLA